jgi:selenocysteine lyase/cysteine desulfurase
VPTTPRAAALTPGGYHSFEHRWALAEAFAFAEAIGRTRIESRTHALASQLKEGLAAMRHVTLVTPRSPALSAGLVCFEVAGQEPHEVVRLLEGRGIVATVTPYARPLVLSARRT